MKFKDIPKFTKTPIYKADVSIFYVKDTIEKYLIEYGLQLNPDFQRGHVWTEEQQIAYIEFILKDGNSGRDIYFNHPGWVKDWKGEFVCVDGLQRLTAILKFTNNELKVFGHYLSEFEGPVDLFGSCVRFYVNDLKTKKEVLQWYLEMNYQGTPHTNEELERVNKLLEKEIS
jgi:uncharacterized protein with ParB-like and HNH nuclease domain